MVNRPKRRKDKDNQYNLDFKENNYVVSFKTVKNEYKEVKVSEEVFKAFDKVPNELWEEEYDKYNTILQKYNDIKVLRWVSN